MEDVLCEQEVPAVSASFLLVSVLVEAVLFVRFWSLLGRLSFSFVVFPSFLQRTHRTSQCPEQQVWRHFQLMLVASDWRIVQESRMSNQIGSIMRCVMCFKVCSLTKWQKSTINFMS